MAHWASNLPSHTRVHVITLAQDYAELERKIKILQGQLTELDQRINNHVLGNFTKAEIQLAMDRHSATTRGSNTNICV